MKANQRKPMVTIVKNYKGDTVKYGKVITKDKGMSTYDKAMSYMKPDKKS